MIWTLIGSVISHGCGLAASMTVARLLGKAGFGALGMVQTTVGMVGVFAGFGLGMTATKHVAEFRGNDPARAGRVIGFSEIFAGLWAGLFAVLLFVLAPILATKTINEPHLVPELRIGSVLLLLNALTGAQTGVLSGLEAFKAIARLNLVRGLASFPALVCGVLAGGLPGAVWGLAAAAAVGWLANHIAVRNECRRANIDIRYRGTLSEMHILWSFSLPALLSSLMWTPVNWLVRTILVNRPDGYSEMGLFTAANQWRTLLLFVSTLMGQVTLPLLSSLVAAREYVSVRRVLAGTTAVSAVVTLPIAILMIFFRQAIMALYGPAFHNGGRVLEIIAITAVLAAIQSPIGHVMIASGQMWLSVTLNVGWAAALVVSAVLLLGAGWGAVGLATSYCVAYVFQLVLVLWYVRATLLSRLDPGSLA